MVTAATETEGIAIDNRPLLPKANFKLYPKQDFALKRPEHEILYGGSRGGAKTIGGIAWVAAPRDCGQYRGLVIRKNADDLKDWIDRATIIYRPYGARKVGTPPEFRWQSGARIRTGHLKDEDSYEKYQGHEYQRMLIEELTQIPTEVRYLTLISSCRSTIKELPAQVFITTNPGGPGHQWVKARFVDCCKPNETYFDEQGRSRIFIPATIDDNPVLMERDPSYVAFLNGLPPGLKEAWRDGSWDFIVGAAFSEINRESHMIDVSNPPNRLLDIFDFDTMSPKKPNEVKIFRAMDWGYSKPFSIGWYFADYYGRLYRFKELYGCKGPDEGIQMPAREVAQKIREIEGEWKVSLSIADASIWDKPGNQNEKAEKLPSIAETMAEEGIWFDREVSIMAKKSRIQGKHQLHERLRVDADGLPHLFVFSTCVHWWRTVPVIPLDDLNPEDVNTDAEDHAYDETRYMLSARPMKARIQKAAPPKMSLNWLQKNYMRPING